MRPYILPAISISLLLSCSKGYDGLNAAGGKIKKTVAFGTFISKNDSRQLLCCNTDVDPVKQEEKECVFTKYSWDPKMLFW